MTLPDFLDSLSADERKQFAKRAGTSVVYLSHLASGYRQPSPRLAKKLHIASGKKVRLHELRPDVWSVRDAA